ncbi:MAG: hypothetical protein E8D49_05640 [Nitrospira sp.]|nr:MAG: hypothetical protein E8D49_05640 [Nitrospira sp.]
MAKFEAYEGSTMIAYETMIYNERGDLTDYAHYRSGDILAWRDLWRYEYDEVGNWTSREHTQVGEEASKSPAMFLTQKDRSHTTTRFRLSKFRFLLYRLAWYVRFLDDHRG